MFGRNLIVCPAIFAQVHTNRRSNRKFYFEVDFFAPHVYIVILFFLQGDIDNGVTVDIPFLSSRNQRIILFSWNGRGAAYLTFIRVECYYIACTRCFREETVYVLIDS